MSDRDYDARVDKLLAGLEDWLEDFDADELDYDAADGVLTLEFPDGTRFVVNRQAAAGQVWLAAAGQAWHFNWSESSAAWVCDKTGRRLKARLAETVSTKLGRDVEEP